MVYSIPNTFWIISPALASIIGGGFSSIWSSSCKAWHVTIEIAEGKIILMAFWTLTYFNPLNLNLHPGL